MATSASKGSSYSGQLVFYHNQVAHKYFENIEQETELECFDILKLNSDRNGRTRGVSLTRS